MQVILNGLHTQKNCSYNYLHSSSTASSSDNNVVGKCIFAACVTRSCVNVTIVNQSFNITLKKAPDMDSRITLDPLVGLVEINDGRYLMYMYMEVTTKSISMFATLRKFTLILTPSQTLQRHLKIHSVQSLIPYPTLYIGITMVLYSPHTLGDSLLSFSFKSTWLI